MTRRLLLGYLSLTAFVLVVLEIPLGITFARFERSSLRAGVRRDAAALALASVETLSTGRGLDLQALVEQYSEKTEGRAVIVDARGEVKADSDPLRGGLRNFSTRPEIEAALRNEEVVGDRYSDSLKTSLVYVATPVTSGGVVRGVVRVTYPESYVNSRVLRGWIVLASVGLTVLAFVFLLSVQLARTVTRPVRELELAAGRLGEGELDARVDVPEGPPELTNLTRSFNETAAKLQRLVDQQRRFAADASHQLRTPLAALRLRLENVEAEVRGEARSEVAEDIEGAIAEVHRLSRLVDGLLALARAERQALPHVAVDLAQVVEETAARWRPLLEERSVALETVVAGGGPVWVTATAGHLEQVIDNLVANAVDVAPAGSVVGVWAGLAGATDSVGEAAASAAGGAEANGAGGAGGGGGGGSGGGGEGLRGMVELHVIDQGPGMTAEQRTAAFDRFWRSTEARSKLGGSGLGLSIVQQLVLNDGGSVELFEAPGGGLDACVRLRPATPPPGDSASSPRRPSRATRRAADAAV